MLVYGDLIAAGLEELASDPTTGLFSGRIYRNTTSGEVRVYSGSTWKTVVDRDTAQTLSAKTIDSSCSISSSASLPVVAPSKGGTGVANNDAATLTMSGSHALTLATTAPTSLTLPTTGTVATLSGQETLVNKVISSTAATTGGLKLPVGDNDAHRPIGTAAQLKGMIRYNDTDDVFEGYNEVGGWSSIGGGGTTDRIIQASHGFVVGDVLYLNGSVYTKAIATAANTAEVVGMVSRVISATQFELTLSGEVTGLTGLTAGEVYFLSSTTAGALTVTEPTAIGHVSLPVGVASSSTTLYVAPKRGVVVGGTTLALSLDGSNITTGTINAARIPSLDASKIATGTLDAARIPSLDSSKITTGTLNAARIPSLDASKITTGVFPVGTFGGGLFVRGESVEIGQGRAENGPAYVDLTSQSSEGDFNARLIRNSGVNADLDLVNIGTGNIKFTANSFEGMRITPQGVQINKNLGAINGIATTNGVSPVNILNFSNRRAGIYLVSIVRTFGSVSDYYTGIFGYTGGVSGTLLLRATLANFQLTAGVSGTFVTVQGGTNIWEVAATATHLVE